MVIEVRIMPQKTKWFKPQRHIGYKEDLSAKENVRLGRSKGESYTRIGRQLNALANVQERENPEGSSKFREAAKLAFMLNKHRHNMDCRSGNSNNPCKYGGEDNI